MTNIKQDLQDKFKAQLLKAISHLEKSYKKSLSLASKLDDCSDDDLESVLEKKFQLITEMKLATQDEKIDLTVLPFVKNVFN